MINSLDFKLREKGNVLVKLKTNPYVHSYYIHYYEQIVFAKKIILCETFHLCYVKACNLRIDVCMYEFFRW